MPLEEWPNNFLKSYRLHGKNSITIGKNLQLSLTSGMCVGAIMCLMNRTDILIHEHFQVLRLLFKDSVVAEVNNKMETIVNTTLVNVAFGARSTKMIGGINKENNIIRISFHFDLERESVLDVFHCEIQKSSHGLLVNIYKDITYTESICPADNKVRITNISAASNTTNAIKPPVTPADITNSTGLQNSTEPTFSTDTKDFWEDKFILVIAISTAFVILMTSAGISLFVWRKYIRAASQNQSRKINAPIEQITLPTISNRVEEITLDKNNASFEEEDHHYESIYVEMDDQIEKNSNSDSDESLYVNMEFQTDEKGIVNVQL